MKTERLPELKAELLLSHEITGAYSASDPAAALEIMEPNIPTFRKNVTGSQLWALTDPIEWDALTDAQRSEWMALCAIDLHSLPVDGVVHKTIERIFPNPGSNGTRDNMLAYRSTDDNGDPMLETRASQLKWGIIHGGDVESARALA